MSRRFDSTSYLADWRAWGRFPPIHDDIYQAVAEHAEGQVFLDLCCSTGLLGERIRRGIRDAVVVGVESDPAAIRHGQLAGINFPVLELQLTDETLPRFREFLAEHRVTTLVARRCIPELCHGRGEFGHHLVATLASAGVREVFLQGRTWSHRSVNSFSSVILEMELFESHFRLCRRDGQVAWLKRA